MVGARAPDVDLARVPFGIHTLGERLQALVQVK